MIGNSERQEAVCALLKQSILELCKASFAYEGNDVIIDGILCISTKRSNGVENTVVKIHDKLWSAKSGGTEARKSTKWVSPGHDAPLPFRNRAITPSLVRPNRSLPQRFETKRNAATPLVSLLTGAISQPKVPKINDTNASPGTDVNKPESTERSMLPESGERSILKGILDTDSNHGSRNASPSPATNNNTEQDVNRQEHEQTQSPNKSDSNETEPITISPVSATKTKSKKGGLDSIVSNLSESARLTQVNVDESACNMETREVSVVHIVPEDVESDSVPGNKSGENNALGEMNEHNNFPNDFGDSDKLFSVNSTESGAIFICEFCEKCLEDRNEFILHREACRSKSIASSLIPARFVCQLCHRHFADFNSLSLHSRIHSVTVSTERRESIWKGKPLTCGLCKCVLRSKRCLQEHMREHAQADHISPFSCVTCECVFPEFGSFKQHRVSYHQSANNCRCEICDLFFTFKEFKTHEFECLNGNRTDRPLSDNVVTNYDISLKDHTVRVIQPEVLDNRSEYDLENDPHENSNSVDSSDKLSIDESFGNDGNASGPTTPVPNSIKNEDDFQEGPCQGPYRCQSCFTVFDKFNDYEVHNHEMHSRFVCSFCAQSFASRRNLTRHARRHTGIKPYQCSECPNTYTRDDDLKKHMSRVHGIKPLPKLRLSLKHTGLTNESIFGGASMVSSNFGAIYNVPLASTSPSMSLHDSDSNHHDSIMNCYPKLVQISDISAV